MAGSFSEKTGMYKSKSVLTNKIIKFPEILRFRQNSHSKPEDQIANGELC